MKLILLILLFSLIPSSIQMSDEPTGHPLESRIDPVSPFGMIYHPILRIERLHAGVDFLVEKGTPVYATADGTIEIVEENSGYGKHVRIRHTNGYETIYAHLGSFSVTVGQKIEKGDRVGHSGNTAKSKRSHLHYEIRKNNEPVDPEYFLPLTDLELKEISN